MKESNLRSFVKGVSWRIVGTLDTIFLSYIFTGKIGDALMIGLFELGSKIILYYFHERIWLRMHWLRAQVKMVNGNIMWKDHHLRSLIKGISWRFFGTLDTIFWAVIVTNDISKGLKIGFAEMFTKVILFYLHERCWLMVKWGTISPLPYLHEKA